MEDSIKTMNRQRIKIFSILGVLSLTWLHCFAAASDEIILLKDGFETLQTASDKTCFTLPEIGAGVATNAKVTGKIQGTAQIIEDQAGKALCLTGMTQVRLPDGNVCTVL